MRPVALHLGGTAKNEVSVDKVQLLNYLALLFQLEEFFIYMSMQQLGASDVGQK